MRVPEGLEVVGDVAHVQLQHAHWDEGPDEKARRA